jgi:hypothetical protein
VIPSARIYGLLWIVLRNATDQSGLIQAKRQHTATATAYDYTSYTRSSIQELQRHPNTTLTCVTMSYKIGGFGFRWFQRAPIYFLVCIGRAMQPTNRVLSQSRNEHSSPLSRFCMPLGISSYVVLSMIKVYVFFVPPAWKGTLGRSHCASQHVI